MKRIVAAGLAGVLIAAACRSKPAPPDTTGMTAEEHARMTAGAADTTGATARQPVHLSADQARAIGVRFTVVTRGPLSRTVRTVGQVVPAEP
ncbi:MAG TPA: hypothetical protein VIV10_10710, partial [Gemmatimonadales bacterium]